MPVAKGNIPWNAGTSKGWVDKRGYRWLYVDECGRKVARREHRVVMERHLGRKLEPWELVHHKDHDKANNALENLELTDFGTHACEHHKGSRRDEDARRSMEAFALMREQIKREREVKAELLEALKESAALLKIANSLADALTLIDHTAGLSEDARNALADFDGMWLAQRIQNCAAIAKATGAA